MHWPIRAVCAGIAFVSMAVALAANADDIALVATAAAAAALIGSLLLERLIAKRLADLAASAQADVLTGVYSRAGLAERLRKIQRRIQSNRGRPNSQPSVGLLFIDVDNFKEINDGYGHDTGDRVLVAVAERLRRNVRATDFVARYGGDEFCVLMDDIGAGTNMRKLEQKLHDAIGRGIELDNVTVNVSISVGSSMLGTDADDLSTLLTIADRRMLEAKARRKAVHRTRRADNRYGAVGF